jgi:hypothetical protein
MKKIERQHNLSVLLPQSIGDNIKWYGFRVSYLDMDAISADTAKHGLPNPNTDIYRRILATGQVGYDALPSLGVNRPQLVAGESAKSEAVTYLLRELRMTDKEIFDFDERLKRWSVNCVIAPHPTVSIHAPPSGATMHKDYANVEACKIGSAKIEPFENLLKEE